jgi:hypothetical protein
MRIDLLYCFLLYLAQPPVAGFNLSQHSYTMTYDYQIGQASAVFSADFARKEAVFF